MNAIETTPRRSFIADLLPQSVNILFKRNSIALIIICRMQVFRSTHLNQRVVETLKALKRLMVFQGEPLLHSIHHLMKAIKLKTKSINLVLIIFLLIMISMINFHVSIGKELHVPFVVWITIMFLDVGREWPHTRDFWRKGSKKPKVHWTRQIMLLRGCICVALTAISKDTLLKSVRLWIQQCFHETWRRWKEKMAGMERKFPWMMCFRMIHMLMMMCRQR